ncbi:MAG TPA: cytochrome c [Stellaceae bacterium]|nr:cytochrome c [Stellaceae bacterium]
MRRHFLALALTVACACLAHDGAALAASAERGKTAFMHAGCWQCHGTAGQGSIAGPKLAPDPLPFESLSAFVRSSSRAMPPFREEVLSDEDLADIYAYLQSIPPAPAPDSIPLLKE